MTLALAIIYAVLVLVAISNLALMRRPRGSAPSNFEVMIPARNEASNLSDVISPLVQSGTLVTVFDDQSTDATAEVARHLGARVITAQTDPPSGWTGKNRANHELAQTAASEWAVFLDADTKPAPDFCSVLAAELESMDPKVNCVSGFPRMLPGSGLEPVYLGWVPWILLSTNPFGLVWRSKKGHNRFTNGQFVAWRTSYLLQTRPYEAVRGEILEDVKLGRLLANRGERVAVLDVSAILSVKMYRNLREAFDGMSKNSGEIAGSPVGSFLFAAFLAIVGVGWAFCGPYAGALYCMLVASKIASDRVVRYPLYAAPFIPLTCLAAAVTILRAVWLKRTGQVTWKGRRYP